MALFSLFAFLDCGVFAKSSFLKEPFPSKSLFLLSHYTSKSLFLKAVFFLETKWKQNKKIKPLDIKSSTTSGTITGYIYFNLSFLHISSGFIDDGIFSPTLLHVSQSRYLYSYKGEHDNLPGCSKAGCCQQSMVETLQPEEEESKTDKYFVFMTTDTDRTARQLVAAERKKKQGDMLLANRHNYHMKR